MTLTVIQPNDSCSECDLGLGKRNYALFYPYNNKQKYCFVMEKPIQADDFYNEILYSFEGEFFKKLLKSSGFDIKACYFTYLTKCYATKVNAPHIKKCFNVWLSKELTMFDTNCIIACGQKPLIKLQKEGYNPHVIPSLTNIVNGGLKLTESVISILERILNVTR